MSLNPLVGKAFPAAPANGAAAGGAGVRRGRVTRLDGDGFPYVEVPRLAKGYEFGPLESLVPLIELAVGTRVLLAYVEGRGDDPIIVGVLDPPVPVPVGGSGPILLAKQEDAASPVTTGTTEMELFSRTVNVPAGRSLKLTHHEGHLALMTAGDGFLFRMYEDAVVVSTRRADTSTAEGPAGSWCGNATPTPGSHTYRVTVQRIVGTGTLTFDRAGTDVKGFFIVEDVTGTEPPTGAYYEAVWTPAPAFQNGWVNYGGTYTPAAYRKVNDLVYLRGLIKNGTLSTPAFYLPAGYRPTWDHHFAGLSNSLLCGIRVFQDGRVTPGDPGSNLWLALDGVVFGVT